MKFNLQKHKYIIIAFLAALLPRLIFLIWTYPMNNTGDELFMFMTPARYAGLDWSGVMEDYRYYGFGLTLFFTPLFRLIDDPVILYRIMVSVMILLQSLIAPVCFYITKRFFHVKEEIFACLLSVICSYFVTLRAVYIYNESMFILLCWITVLLLLLLNEKVNEKKTKRVLTFVLMVILVYAMTIHSRAIVLWISLGVVTAFYLWTYRKWLISPAVVVIVGGAGYFLSRKAIDHMAAAVGMTEAGADIANTSVSFSISAIFDSLKSLTGWAYIVLGQINTIAVMVGGIALFAAIVGTILIWNALVKRKEVAEQGERQHLSAYTVVAIFSLAAVAITILGLSFSWLGGVTESIETGQNNDSMRAVTYIRYYAAHFGPLLMMGLLWMREQKDSFRKLFPYVLGGMILLEGFWTCCILPYVADYGGTFWEYAPFSGIDGWTDQIRLRAYLPGIAVAFLITFICYYLYRKKKMNLVLGLLCAVLFYEYAYGAVVTDGERGRLNYEYSDDIYEVLHSLDEQGELPYEIYTQKAATADTHQSVNYQYQYMFKEHKIVQGLPPEDAEEAVFLTSYFMEYPELVREGYLCAQLDNDEYIHVKGERLQELIKAQGVELENYMRNETQVALDQFNSDNREGNASLDSLQSNGNEGEFIYGYSVPFSGGEMEIIFDLELLENSYDDIGTVEIWKEGRESCVYTDTLSAADFAEDGTLELTIRFTCNATSALEPIITLTDGTVLKMNSCTFKRISNVYEVGTDSPEDTEAASEIIRELDETAQIVYLHPYKNCELSLDYLEKVLGAEVELVLYDGGESQIQGEKIIVVPNDESFIFNVIPTYTITARTGSYTIMVPAGSELEKTAEEKDMILSGEEGISTVYFQNQEKDGLISDHASFNLSAGGYRLTAVVKSESTEGRFRLSKEGETVTEAPLSGEGGELTAFVELESYANNYALQTEIFLPKGEVAGETVVYISKYW